MTQIIDCIFEGPDPVAVRAALDDLTGAVSGLDGVDAQREEIVPSQGIAETVFTGSVLLAIAGQVAMGLAVNAIWHWIATRGGKKAGDTDPEINRAIIVEINGIKISILPHGDTAPDAAEGLPPG